MSSWIRYNASTWSGIQRRMVESVIVYSRYLVHGSTALTTPRSQDLEFPEKLFRFTLGLLSAELVWRTRTERTWGLIGATSFFPVTEAMLRCVVKFTFDNRCTAQKSQIAGRREGYATPHPPPPPRPFPPLH